MGKQDLQNDKYLNVLALQSESLTKENSMLWTTKHPMQGDWRTTQHLESKAYKMREQIQKVTLFISFRKRKAQNTTTKLTKG